jgi:hypothetical protein
MGRKSQCEDLLPEILALKEQGLMRIQIADQLGLQRGALDAYCLRRNIHFPKGRQMLKVSDSQIRSLAEQGLTHRQIAEALGVYESTIEKRCSRMGLRTGRTGPRSGAGHPEWEGGRHFDKHGYILVWAPFHPHARKSSGCVLEHILVRELDLGRYLDPKEVVHHKDNHPYHNWPSNLDSYACNADHLIDELTGQPKSSPRRSIPGAYGCSQKIDRCPSEDETLAQCPSEIRQRLVWYIESHRPTTEHRMLARREFLRSGAWRDPFLLASTA